MKIFRHVDRNADGVLSAQEFQTFYTMLRRVTEDSSVLAMLLEGESKSKAVDFSNESNAESEEEVKTLYALMRMLDPFETDRVTFSSAVNCLNQLQQQATQQQAMQQQLE